MQHLLLVDDEAPILNALYRTLRPHLASVLKIDLCTHGAEALQRGQRQRYDVVIADLRMPGMDGMTLLTRFAQLQPHSVRMMLTGSADFATAQRAVNEIGIFRYLTKPWLEAELLVHLRAAMQHAAQLTQTREQADAWAALQAQPSPQELERRRLEALEPGLTDVEWSESGSVIMPLLDDPVP
jgi:two-component system, probable response regulator PhcQ